VEHLPYRIDPQASRLHHYENLWKNTAFSLLDREEADPTGWSHLDFGCGRGESMALAASRGMTTQGVDVDPECVRLSSVHGPASLLGDEAIETRFEPSSYDLVTCFHVLEHVSDPRRTLAVLGRIARRRLLVAVPNLSAFHDLLRPRTRWDRPVNEGHLQAWDHAHFRNLAERHCGLRILAWGFDAVMLPPFTHWIECMLGPRPAIALETGPLKWLFPYASLSVIAMLEPIPDQKR
jgi:SAM-dependent methyltransferase